MDKQIQLVADICKDADCKKQVLFPRIWEPRSNHWLGERGCSLSYSEAKLGGGVSEPEYRDLRE